MEIIYNIMLVALGVVLFLMGLGALIWIDAKRKLVEAQTRAIDSDLNFRYGTNQSMDLSK